MRSAVRGPAALAQCKPLSDPVRVFANILRFWIGLAGVVLIFALASAFYIAVQRNARVEGTGVVIVLIALAGMLSAPLGLWLFFRTANRRPVIYLRAFRSDRPARRLRSLLKAALGNRFRLSGIRSPQKRARLLTRLFAQNVVALRYVGSESFELEAHDRDWMARLLATYVRCQFVFIDLRDVTPHVENEIRLSYLAMGPERCVFLIDSNRRKDEWLLALRTVLGGEATERTTFHLLEYPGDDRVDAKTFVAEAREIIDRLPLDPVVISDKAVSFAKEHVGEQNWATSFWDTNMGSQLLSQGMGVALFGGGTAGAVYLGEQPASLLSNLFAIIGLAGLATFFVAWWRAWKQARIDGRFRRPGTRSPRWRLCFSLFLVVFSPAYITLSALTVLKLNQDVELARHTRVQEDIQSIKTQLQTYQVMNGFYPTAEQGLQALVTLPNTEPRPDRWFQLFKEIPKDPWQNNYIYRCPGIRHPDSYDLFSAGPDQKSDTADDDWGE